MASKTGFTQKEINRARNLSADAALLSYHNRHRINYTQGPQRWEGIERRCDPRKGEYPRNADCSAHNTWCLWVPLFLVFGLEDIVNGQNWKAGYTGTQLNHGRNVTANDSRKGDLVLYGKPGTTGAHVAIVVRKGPNPLVVSHGSQSGPHLLAFNYRKDIICIKRYIPPLIVVGGGSGGSSQPKPASPTKPPKMRVDYISTDHNARHPDVKIWQDRMKARGWKIEPDGWFGKESLKVLNQFKREKGLAVDNRLGLLAWNYAWTKPITK